MLQLLSFEFRPKDDKTVDEVERKPSIDEICFSGDGILFSISEYNGDNEGQNKI